MLNLFVWSEIRGEWLHWCRCRPQNLCQLRAVAEQCNIDFYWTGF